MKKNKALLLHDLVHSLTTAEKKYVRLNLKKYHPKEESKQLLLFDTLNKQKQYKEEEIEALYKKRYYSFKHLPVDRSKLYDFILSSARDFNVKIIAEARLYEEFQKVMVLFEKKLFGQALKLIDKTKKNGYKHEMYGFLIELLSLEQRILKVVGRVDDALKLLDEQEFVWRKQQLINQYIRLHYQSVKLRIQLSKVRDEKALVLLEELMNNPLWGQAEQTRNFWSDFHRLETLCNYHFIRDEREKELFYNEQLIKLYQKYEWFKDNQPLNFLIIHTRILVIRRHFAPESFLEDLEAYRKLGGGFKKQVRECQSIIFIFSYNYELDTHLRNRDWKLAAQLIPIMQKGFQQYQNLIRADLLLGSYHRFAHACFFTKEYGNALKYLRVIQQDFESTTRPDVYYFSFLFQIIIHYELGNYKLLPYLLRTAKYRLEKHHSIYNAEALIMSFLKKLSNEKKLQEHHVLFTKFDEEIKHIFQSEYERRILQIFDLTAWIEANLLK